MGKVVTSQGLTEFVTEGKVTNVPDHKAKLNGEAPALEKVADKPIADVTPAKEPEKTEAKPEPNDEGLEAEDSDFPERVKRKINAKHRAMKEAQELAAENERFAESQYNERRLALQRAEAAERELAELKAKAQPAKEAEELKKPTVQEFTDAQGQVDWDKYTDAKADYAAKVAVNEERARQAAERAEAEKAELTKTIAARVNKAREAHPDFDKVMEKADLAVPNHIQAYLAESEMIGELGYYFAQHPEEFERISKMKPILAIAEVGKVEVRLTAKVETPKPEPTSRGGAPAPITPLNPGAAPINTDPAKMSFRELREYERQRMMNKH